MQWKDALTRPEGQASTSLSWLELPGGLTAVPGASVFLFADSPSGDEARLPLRLEGDRDGRLPEFTLVTPTSGCRLELHRSEEGGIVEVTLIVPAAPESGRDDEVAVLLRGQPERGTPSCLVLLRRTACLINTALLDRHGGSSPLWPQTRAALLFHGWKRYQELVALKRFSTGLSGADVLVFRPRLRDPEHGSSAWHEAEVPGVLSRAWGSCLLVKTGPAAKLRQEWERFQTFLVSRLHPFMGRTEALLEVQAPEDAAAVRTGIRPTLEPSATLIGSFLGGEALQVEPLEWLMRTAPAERLAAPLTRLFSVLAPWYGGAVQAPLDRWRKVFGRDGDGPLLLFGKYDLTRSKGRQSYARELYWDLPFVSKEHLHHHLLGRDGRSGLLPRLAERIEVRYSLIHGDLHPRNILAEGDHVWLIDFGEAGVGPTLFDFAKLEVMLRLWCLDLGPGGADLEALAREFEEGLLELLIGSEASLAPVHQLAERMDVDAGDLGRLARSIDLIRRQALSYTVGRPDRCDYLAVLYLTVLHTLRYFHKEMGRLANYRLLMALAWTLEEILSRFVGLEPFRRSHLSVDLRRLLSREWLAAPRAPARVRYLLQRPEGRKALAPLVAARGVLQNESHHLDVLDHTLLVLANLEVVLDAPLAALEDPVGFERAVADSLREQGFPLVPLSQRPAAAAAPASAPPWREEVARFLEQRLDPGAKLLLKWVALLHDVGKPGTRRQTADVPPRVQFRGHEAHGLNLLGDTLRQLFPGEDEDGPGRQRLRGLIAQHHLHHVLLDRFLQPARLAGLRQALVDDDAGHEELRFLASHLDKERNPRAADFPLLILHGFADVAACKGTASRTALAAVAEVDLWLLAVAARYDRLTARRRVEEFSSRASYCASRGHGLAEFERRRLQEQLVAWCREQAFAGAPQDWLRQVPRPQALRAQASHRTGGPASAGPDWDTLGADHVTAILLGGDAALSRTHKGVSDTSSSAHKPRPLLEGEALRQRCRANAEALARFLWEQRRFFVPGGAAEVLELLLQIADHVNAGLHADPRALRSWPLPADQGRPEEARDAWKVAPGDVAAALQTFAAEVWRRWPELYGDPVPLAAWAEWQLNGGLLHPFADGCGRISRAFGVFLLMGASWPTPLYEGAESYYEHGHRGPAAFADYVRAAIARRGQAASPAGGPQ